MPGLWAANATHTIAWLDVSGVGGLAINSPQPNSFMYLFMYFPIHYVFMEHLQASFGAGAWGGNKEESG